MAGGVVAPRPGGGEGFGNPRGGNFPGGKRIPAGKVLLAGALGRPKGLAFWGAKAPPGWGGSLGSPKGGLIPGQAGGSGALWGPQRGPHLGFPKGTPQTPIFPWIFLGDRKGPPTPKGGGLGDPRETPDSGWGRTSPGGAFGIHKRRGFGAPGGEKRDAGDSFFANPNIFLPPRGVAGHPLGGGAINTYLPRGGKTLVWAGHGGPPRFGGLWAGRGFPTKDRVSLFGFFSAGGPILGPTGGAP